MQHFSFFFFLTGLELHAETEMSTNIAVAEILILRIVQQLRMSYTCSSVEI